jgi:hypothetical protein
MFIFQTNTRLIIFAGIFKLLLQEQEEDLGEINETIYLFIFHLHILSERVKLNLWNYFATSFSFRNTREKRNISF